jgi:integrase
MDVSEKKSTKVASQLPWRVKSIDNLEKNFKHLKGKIQFKFITSGILKGLHLVWNTETNVKSFRLVGKCKNKTFTHTCGKYYPGVTKLTDIENYISDLCKKYKDRDGYWVANPNNENITKDQLKKTQTYTIRECIELIAKEGFPKLKYDNPIDVKSIQQYSQILFGWNDRREYLSFKIDDKQNACIEIRDNLTWDRLFKKFPHYKGVEDDKPRSIYDSQLGGLPIDDLSVRLVETWCNKGTTQGNRLNRLKAFKYLYRTAQKLNLLSDQDKLDPTRISNGGVNITGSMRKISRTSKYNNISFTVPQLEKIINSAWKIKDEKPFKAEAILFIAYSGRRAEEVKKIKIENLYNHFGEPNNEVITLPTEIVKSRKEPEIVIINENIKKVLNSCEEHRSKPEFAKLKFVPWLFPNPHFALEKYGDVEFCRSEKTRYHYLSDVWKLIEKDTGIQGAQKLFRKSIATIGAKTFGPLKATQITGHKDVRTLEKYYYKESLEDTITTANELGKIYQFKK